MVPAQQDEKAVPHHPFRMRMNRPRVLVGTARRSESDNSPFAADEPLMSNLDRIPSSGLRQGNGRHDLRRAMAASR